MKRERLEPFLLPLLFLGTVQLLAQVGWVDARYLPTPRVVALGLVELSSSGELWGHLGITLGRVVRGFALASVLGIGFGLWLGQARTAREFLLPSLEVMRSVPGVALLPLTVLWFGLGSGSQIPVIAFAGFFPLMVNAMHGAEEIPSTLIAAARVMELRGVRLFAKVLLPAAVPQIVTGLKLSVVYALTSAVGAEIIAGTDGLGFLILNYQRTLATSKMFATMIVVAVLGMGLTGLVRLGESRWFSYRKS